MSIAALAVFQAANILMEDRVYETRLLSEGGGEVPTAAGFAVASHPLEPEIYDTLLVAARIGTEPAPAALVAFTRETAATSRRVGVLCTGAFTLAQAASCRSAVPRRIGATPASCRRASPTSGSRRTVSSSMTARSGPRPG
ncbi:hypothetical protein [Methylobacterium sp. 174MFSha1.1]|uniref:hypothetical protein n=1 Tax=Methylobacterium sp. 174MFSha1.1 TaxID=1502749 RepID=UPI0032979EEE